MIGLAMLAGLAVAAAPAPVTPTDKERAELASGAVVVRPAPHDTGEMIGIVDLRGATAADAWRVVLDWDMRVASVGAITAITEYAPEASPGGLGMTFELSVLGTAITYHLRYDIDRAGGWCTFALDPDKEHDIVQTQGSYQLAELPDGIRLTYRSKTDTGRAIPGFVRKWLATSSIRDQLSEMQRRAQGG